jgi:hypothetical protein
MSKHPVVESVHASTITTKRVPGLPAVRHVEKVFKQDELLVTVRENMSMS